MDLLKNRPNVLFSVCLRLSLNISRIVTDFYTQKPTVNVKASKNIHLLHLTNLKRDIFYRKFIKVLTTYYKSNDLEVWHVLRQIHRDDGPAVITADVQKWYKHNVSHRLDGPAIIHVSGSEEWFYEGKRHREGAPAVINANGDYGWYRHGNLHRDEIINGVQQPAQLYSAVNGNKTTVWYINGVICRNDGLDEPSYVTYNPHTGAKSLSWYKDGVMHRETGPAIISFNGAETWYLCNNVVDIERLDSEIEDADKMAAKYTQLKNSLLKIRDIKK